MALDPRLEADQVTRQAQKDELEGQVTRLRGELAYLTRVRADVIAETQRAKEQFTQFTEYEARARRELAAKERELQDREMSLPGNAGKPRRSFLAGL